MRQSDAAAGPCHPYRAQGPRERSRSKEQSHGADHGVLEATSEQPVDGCAYQGQHRNDPKIQVLVHNFSSFTWSTFKVSRVRKTEIMIASPTAASAAATTITKKTKICPLSCFQCAAKATNDRFTAFSISSMAMKMVMMLRFSRNARTPSANRIALSTR